MLAKNRFYKTKRPNSLAVRRRRARLMSGILILIIFTIAIFSLSWFLSQPFVVINNLTVSGNSLVAASDIIAAVKNILTDSYLGLFTKSNIFIYPEKTIRQTLTATFPAIKDIRGNIKSWQTLQLSVEERAPFALWCRTIDATDCFYLDDDGLIFSTAAIFSDSIFLKFSGGQISASSSPIGKNFLPSDEFRRLNFFLDSLAPLNLMPASLIAGVDEYQIYLKNGGRLIISIDDDLSKVLENLETILSSDNLKKALARGGVIDYIDLRYGNKIFYKFKN
ncbi:MAG: hypothetical protein AAB952_01715 [Patescibacteria group bacterium]